MGGSERRRREPDLQGNLRESRQHIHGGPFPPRRRGNERIECAIQQADHEVAFRWLVDDELIIDLDLHDVVGLEVRQGQGKESLVISTGDPHQRPIQIDISPRVSLVLADEPR